MTRGRKPKPTALRLVTGNAGKRKINKREPKPTGGAPTCPDFLSKEAKAEWKRVVPELDRLGLITAIDRAAIAVYCQLWGRVVEAERALAVMAEADKITQGLLIKTTNGSEIQNPLVGVANKAMEAMLKMAVEFGMTPSSRARLVAGPITGEKRGDPFDDFLRDR